MKESTPGWRCCSRTATTNGKGCFLRWDVKPQGCRDEHRGSSSFGHWAKQAGAGRRKDPLSPECSLTSQPPSEHWGLIALFNHKKQIRACHQRAVGMETAAQTSMGHTHAHTEGGKKLQKSKSCNFFPFYFQFIRSTAGKTLPDSFRAFDIATTQLWEKNEGEAK